MSWAHTPGSVTYLHPGGVVGVSVEVGIEVTTGSGDMIGNGCALQISFAGQLAGNDPIGPP